MPRLAVTAALAAAVLCSAASAQTAPGAALWRQMAVMDVEAAYALVRDNHPAALPEVGDDAFRAALDAAAAKARARAEQVTSFEGYTATLSGFATAFGDKHIWHRPTVRVAAYQWPGLSISRRGGAWRVNEEVRSGNETPLAGATLLGCDGRSADALAEERLGGFRAVWSIEAQRIQQAPWLLIDDGNPFLARPATCDFDVGGKRVTHTLQWRPVSAGGIAPYLTRAVSVGQAGWGVRQAGGGYWIAIQGLDSRTQPVLDQVQKDIEAIRSAPFVVLDMRGNGGGASQYGDTLARMLTGDRYYQRVQTGGTAECVGPWRASAGNLKHLQDFLSDNRPRLSAELIAYLENEVRMMQEAIAGGRAFTQPPRACPAADRPAPPPLDGRGSLMKGRLIVLTDNACFSSCLLVTDLFRRLGALHVGEATDAATRYMEVREIPLPSGAGYFSTLQKVAFGAPRQIGPFVPARLYPGDIADTAGLEAWVAEQARR